MLSTLSTALHLPTSKATAVAPSGIPFWRAPVALAGALGDSFRLAAVAATAGIGSCGREQSRQMCALLEARNGA